MKRSHFAPIGALIMLGGLSWTMSMADCHPQPNLYVIWSGITLLCSGIAIAIWGASAL